MKKIFNLLLIGAILAFAASCSKKGCKDSTATNYDPKAKKDDGSCIYEKKDTNTKDTTVIIDKDTPVVELFKGSCTECITASGYILPGTQLRFNFKVTYDKPLKNIKVVRSVVGSGTTTPIDSNINDSFFTMEWFTSPLAVGEKSIFTFSGTGENGKVGNLTITLTAGTGDLGERFSKIYMGNANSENFHHSFDLKDAVSVPGSVDNAIKDFNEPSTGAFLKKLNSLNGSKFKIYGGTRVWLQIKTKQDLIDAWNQSGSELNEININGDGDFIFLVKSTQNDEIYIINIEEIDEISSPAEILFRLKGVYD